MANTKTDTLAQFTGPFRFVRFESVRPYPYAISEQFKLSYIRKGSVNLTIGSESVTLQEGDLALAAPFVFHKNDASQDAVVDIMNIAPFLCGDASQIFSNKCPQRPFLRKEEIPPLAREVLETIARLAQEQQKPRHYKDHHAQAYQFEPQQCHLLQPYLTVLLLELSRQMPLTDLDTQNVTTMQKVMKHCAVNFHQEITRHSVARDCNVSIGIVSQTFNRLGISFRDYINALRVNHAYYLLTTTKKPITEIIYECGYSNQGTFNRNFQLQFGKSPRDLRHGR